MHRLVLCLGFNPALEKEAKKGGQRLPGGERRGGNEELRSWTPLKPPTSASLTPAEDDSIRGESGSHSALCSFPTHYKNKVLRAL